MHGRRIRRRSIDDAYGRIIAPAIRRLCSVLIRKCCDAGSRRADENLALLFCAVRAPAFADAAFEPSCNRCGRRRRRSACRARPSTPRRAASSRICRCPISPFPAGRKSRRQQAEFVQTPAQYLREATFDAARRAGQEARRAISRHAGAHREGDSACRAMSCWRSGRARPITAATSCRTTRSACWRRRPIPASARISSATNSCTR